MLILAKTLFLWEGLFFRMVRCSLRGRCRVCTGSEVQASKRRPFPFVAQRKSTLGTWWIVHIYFLAFARESFRCVDAFLSSAAWDYVRLRWLRFYIEAAACMKSLLWCSRRLTQERPICMSSSAPPPFIFFLFG